MWTKDAISQAPNIVYTLDESAEGVPKVSTMTYYPNATDNRRWIIRCYWLHKEDEDIAFIDQMLGITPLEE